MWIKEKKLRVFLLLLLAPSLSYAYVDPGLGGLLFQGFIALIGALILFFKDPIKFIRSLFKSKGKE